MLKPNSFCLPDDRNPREIARAWGDYLHSFPWDHVAHLTYRESSPSVECIQEDFEDRWIRRIARNAQHPVRWFCMIERGRSGLHHVHALVSGTADLTIRQLDWAWRRPRFDKSRIQQYVPATGNTKIQRYNPAKGAGWYLTKAIAEFPDNWNMSRSWWNDVPRGLR